jgi:chromosome segregation ATPase
MNKTACLLLLGSALGLAACTGSTDPTTATLFDNIRNLQTGEYDRQIAAKDAEAAAIIANNRAAQSRISGLESQSASNSQAISALRAQIASVRGQAQAARAAVAGDPAKLARLNQLEGQISAVQADVNGGADPAVARAELNRVSAAIRALAG